MGPWIFVFELLPSKAPDLNPVDIFVGSSWKFHLCPVAGNDLAELLQRIEDGCKIFRNITGIFELVHKFLMIGKRRLW
jgi:hypothetical protein